MIRVEKIKSNLRRLNFGIVREIMILIIPREKENYAALNVMMYESINTIVFDFKITTGTRTS